MSKSKKPEAPIKAHPELGLPSTFPGRRVLRGPDNPEMRQRREDAKAMTPPEWRSLKHAVSLWRVMDETYAQCWPSARSKSKIPGVNAATLYILNSPSWKALGLTVYRETEDRHTEHTDEAEGFTTIRTEPGRQRHEWNDSKQRALIDKLIFERGEAILKQDIRAKRRPASVLKMYEAPLIIALNEPHLGPNIKRRLRDELKRMDRERSQIGEHDFDLDASADLNPEEVAERSEALARVFRASACMRQLEPHLKRAGSLAEAIQAAGLDRSTVYDEFKRLKIALS